MRKIHITHIAEKIGYARVKLQIQENTNVATNMARKPPTNTGFTNSTNPIRTCETPNTIPIPTTLDRNRLRNIRYTEGHSETQEPKTHGIDGIPGEVYKTLKRWEPKDIYKILNLIKQGHKISETWVQGSVVQIYKHNGAQGCNPHQSIRLTQVIYKILSQLMTIKLAQVLRIVSGRA